MNLPRLLVVSLMMGVLASDTHAATPSPTRVREAITQGVTFLEHAQLPHGEFPVDCMGAYDSTPFGTGTILYSLRFVDDRRLQEMEKRAVAFLLGEMEYPGLWRYCARRNPNYDVRVVPDFDDTSVVGLALLAHGVVFPRDLDFMLHFRTPEHAFVTWMTGGGSLLSQEEINNSVALKAVSHYYTQNIPDCVVNAQTLAYFTYQGRALPEVCTYLTQLLVEGTDPTKHTIYYSANPYPFTYAVSKAYREGATCLKTGITPLMTFVRRRQRFNGSWGNALETALATATLLNLGDAGRGVDSAVTFLLTHQRTDGSWPSEIYYGSSQEVIAYGSPSLTTGFALEALGKYLTRQGHRR